MRTGLREVALHDWVFSVNGEPLFVKGVNVAPTRQALADATPAEVRRDVELAREAGLDLIRVNGHIARPELYDAADEMGMLVWQDFPLQWTYARTIRKEAVRQAREAVDQLGHHPSIAVWCAHNEPLPVEESRKKTFGPSIVRHVVKEQVPTWNKTILDRWVKRAFETADETRAVIAHSGVAPHVPQFNGTDSHLFFGWFHGDERDIDTFAASLPRMVRFVSEFGAQSVPDSADVHAAVAVAGARLGRVGRATRHATRGLRGARAAAPVRDVRPVARCHTALPGRPVAPPHRDPPTPEVPTHRWFLPADAERRAAVGVSWSILDHERHPKLAYAAVVEACRPVIVVAERPPAEVVAGDTIALDVHVVSDVRRVLEGVQCTATLRWAGGDHTWTWTGDVPPDDCVRVGTAQFVVPDTAGDLWLDLVLEHGEIVVTNRYTSTITPRA